MKNYIHFLYVPFTGLGLHNGYRGDSWLANRIAIFKEYTLKSILNQTNQNFVVWISWRAEEKTNPQVKDLEEYIKGKGLKAVFTFGGVCFWDDKYKNDKLFDRLKATLPDLKDYCEGRDWVLMTIYPSDDMYSKEMARTMQAKPMVEGAAYGYRNGYMLNIATGEISEYSPKTSPPFYTIIFPKEKFVNPYLHYGYTGPYKSHEYIPTIFKFEKLDSRSYCVGVHGENISTAWKHPYQGAIVDNLVKRDFGVSDSARLKFKAKGRLFFRQIFNKLPSSSWIYKIYKKV